MADLFAMYDPWDTMYKSCMKINGVPLLPPVLCKERRKEMHYYKLLAKEVEARIRTLKSFVESDTDSTDITDAPELPESEQNDLSPQSVILTDCDTKKEKFDLISDTPKMYSPLTDFENSKSSSKLVIDLSLSLNNSSFCSNKSYLPIELPVRDCDSARLGEKILSQIDPVKANIEEDRHIVSVDVGKNISSDTINLQFEENGSFPLKTKIFTGSLNDIHKESSKDMESIPLSRQRSYTVLIPSPLLMAHLEVQSQSKGVEINSISMSESLSNLTSPSKKRRSWDLETAKVKWSSMALELKNKNINAVNKNVTAKPAVKKTSLAKARARSVQERNNRVSNVYKPMNKSDSVQKSKNNFNLSRSNSEQHNRPIVNKAITPKQPLQKDKEDLTTKKHISESEDPATRVRELYEKIQKQQLAQMENLVEKQKKEQMLLQQVFEEQNNLLYSQLKTICPKPPNKVKEAWSDENKANSPVSLSQVINHIGTERTSDSPVATLTDTNNYLNQCDNVLKRSRDITGNIKKQTPIIDKAKPKAGQKPVQRNASPDRRSTSRKLTYESSASTNRDYEPLLTDRTNDTMADLNVTFTTDDSDEYRLFNQSYKEQVNTPATYPTGMPAKYTDLSLKSMEETIQKSLKSMCAAKNNPNKCQPTVKERAAAAKIVACAKGYLVRRLMRTERVQTTVQTIKDALLCALQLHQDREGIRGADVDLHRRLIQQITAACYNLHDTFITSSPAERCAMISADRSRRRSLALRSPPRLSRPTDLMTQSHCGSFPPRAKRVSASLMTHSYYESCSEDRVSRRYVPTPRPRPWR
ncbi:uncharacterized protein LOC126979519 isoform X3 [Leptidea sinapis]|uniref:uncharacterized protein LOC126979519 isoform X3 n=1 Tax=Leptidea sinapis TaxID=189913 RepID=UPI002146DFD6|nr:uncharacterized protein LOC126979519 isoform X3 [Leptidea sinapis]